MRIHEEKQKAQRNAEEKETLDKTEGVLRHGLTLK